MRERSTRDPQTGVWTATRETVYGITSLPRARADAAQLTTLVRGHWGIENRLHWVRDVTFQEDHSQIRTGHGPQQMATFRNTAIALCRLNNHPQIAATRRFLAWNPQPLFTSLGFVQH